MIDLFQFGDRHFSTITQRGDNNTATVIQR
ncbi:curlin repeat-containing protein [Natronogracilivirgula saccharolytica]|uniref:Curlin repeat-containing protein n=1 Tax=Natronogracilivirga saccharolytica TaxID=2812953 RepID=A0A8J7RM62_9BACT|nr:curlin repeat-containing protein [Natronogracilivirga saccharolytica]